MLAQKVPLFFKKYHDWLGLAYFIAAWIVGCCAGVAIFQANKALCLSLMYGVGTCKVSVVGLLTCTAMPFLATAISCIMGSWIPVYMLAFIKAMSYSVCSASIFGLYGTGGWVAQFLLLFSENASIVLLFALWICLAHRVGNQRSRYIRISLICALLCCIVNVFLISPFCVSVFTT